MTKKVYFENLDGLRFLAFFSVFLFHSFYTSFNHIKTNEIFMFFHKLTRYGWLGVNFFFVLSGFLITYLILLEEKQKGKIQLGKFYIRRILRIWPLYYLIIAFCFLIYPILLENFALTPDDDLPGISLFLLHLSNYNYIYTPSEIPTLNILWSISIEEQFYLLWPLLLIIVKGKLRYLVLILLLITSAIFTFIHKNDFHYHHHHILNCMSDLIVGGLCAMLVLNVNGFVDFFKQLSDKKIYLIYTLIGIYFSSVTYHLLANSSLITSLMFAFIILEQNYSVNSPLKVSKIPYLSFLGRYTFGMY